MPENLPSALADFQRARRKADIEQVLARLMGQSNDLLSYEDVRRKLRANNQIERGLQDVPLDKIVGSVGRYKDFTRTFLPKDSTNEHRWANLLVVNSSGRGLPPVELYQIGDAYFVLDGNHRVSIMRQQGFKTIQAYVTEVLTKVPFSADMNPDLLILTEQYADFLERTRFHDVRPEADLTVTAPGKYALLEEHIQVHNYFMGLDFQREVDWEESVAHWYDEVYLPTIQMIRERGILRYFPERTETDLYIWLAEHRAELEESLGWDISTRDAVEDLAEQHGFAAVSRVGSRVLDALVPDEFDPGPPPGEWRRYIEQRDQECIFGNILVSVTGYPNGWDAVEQAIRVAQRENGEVRGLHLRNEGYDTEAIQAEFEQRLLAANVLGRLAIDEGTPYRKIVDRARWNDLVVLSMAFPPGDQMLDRLRSNWRTVILRSPRPILAVPGPPSNLARALLAYDGSPKAEEALYVAAYVAQRWGTSLVILSVGGDEKAEENLGKARAYLEQQGVTTADFHNESGDVDVSVLLTAEKHGCDFILMGGYGSTPVIELVLGSTVDKVLRNSKHPLLICR